MTDAEFEALEEQEHKLWREVQELETPYKDKTAEWQAVFAKRNLERLRREVRAEMQTNPSEERVV